MKKKPKGDKIDRLAVTIKHEFDRVHDELNRLHAMDKLLFDSLELVKADVRDMKTTLGPMVRMLAMQDRELDMIKTRLVRLERKVGVK